MENTVYSIDAISALIIRLLTGSITAEEMAQLYDWLNQHEDNRWLFEQLTETDDIMRTMRTLYR